MTSIMHFQASRDGKVPVKVPLSEAKVRRAVPPPVKESFARALGIEDLGIADLGIEDLGIADLGIEDSVLIDGVIEADRRLPLQHGLRFNLTAKPYLAGHNQNAASQRGVATVATYRFASRRWRGLCQRHRWSSCIAAMSLCRLLPRNNRLGMFAKEN